LTVNLKYINDVYLKVETEDRGILREIYERYSFEVPAAKYDSRFIHGKWDGLIHLLNARTGQIYAGLKDSIIEYCKEENIPVTTDIQSVDKDITRESVQAFIDKFNIVVDGDRIIPHDYQVEAVYQAVKYKRRLFLSPTSSGKSLIIALIFMWHLKHKRKMLLIVPTIQLVEQMKSDILEYFHSDFGDKLNEMIHTVWGGVEKESDRPLIITTYQSYMKDKASPQFMASFDVVMGDEAHLYKSTEIKAIMERLINCEYRNGFTGTTDGTVTTLSVLEGLFGYIYQTISTRELIDRGLISDIKIKCIVLKYSDDIRKDLHNRKDEDGKKIPFKYEDEMDYIVFSQSRNEFIRKLAITLKGNTLILFNRVDDHGKVLYNLIKDSLPEGRNIFYVSGEIKGEAREVIRKQIEKEENSIIIASKVFTTGTNMKKLNNLITVNPTKSQNTTLQSIGRVLRKAKGKTHATLYDIADDLSWRKTRNHTLGHFFERVKMYSRDQFDYQVINIDIK
jgi:superfamily II DNA or RNA helicase